MSTIISFFIFPLFFRARFGQTTSQNTTQTSSIFYPNSTLPSTWYNNNSNSNTITNDDGSEIRVVLSNDKAGLGFVCGFYCKDNSCFLSVVLHGGGDASVVWSARDPVQKNTLSQLTQDGDLVLLDSDGAKSFDHPTDTLLDEQRFNEGQNLISSSSATNWSRGLYYATLTSSTGFAAYTDVGEGQSLMYYQLVPERSSRTSTGSNYAEFQQEGFIVNLGTSQATFRTTPSAGTVKYLKLDSDGYLKIYQHGNASGLSGPVDMVTQDLGKCQHPRQFGEVAMIPLTCTPSLDQQHHLVEVTNVTYFNVIDPDAAFPNIRDIEQCKQACLQNCSCTTAFFRHDNNVSDGYCYMPSKILTIREGPIPNHNFTAATYIKVQIPYKAPNPVPAPNPPNPVPEGAIPEVSPPTPPSRKRPKLTPIIAGSIAGVLVILGLVIVIYWLMLRKTNAEDVEDSFKLVPGMPVRFSYEDLHVATRDFEEQLGVGGFGTVYKGILRDGTSVAVKRLDKLSQGMKEFVAEVETIGSIHHFNLVRLIGFCAEKSQRLLVYEYMSKGSLDKWIFYRDQRPCLDWQTRKRIILDIAKGLAYLHEDCRQTIIHRDIKPQNILLDEKYNAKVSDFGLSKLIDRSESQVISAPRGTLGCIAPEWQEQRINVRVDIYSFGIVLIEIVSGRRHFDNTKSESSQNLLKVLQKKAGEDQIIDIVENLEGEVPGRKEEVERMIRIGAWCLQDDQTRRPPMSTVVKVLEGVMEVDPDITFNFAHANAMVSPAVANGAVSATPQASVLSNPRS
ncbi:hypothetical protein F0562_008545 [Nyssa sinensis]|uniref:non-specific serine/threonine protein kinase n=1 Tax=Nyssa sinensis TaxID=561372 RepID=A0A5J5A8N9_9ASTE|nr:hypothetical protein F0562_008545 [Nyssa sinensis]